MTNILNKLKLGETLMGKKKKSGSKGNVMTMDFSPAKVIKGLK